MAATKKPRAKAKAPVKTRVAKPEVKVDAAAVETENEPKTEKAEPAPSIKPAVKKVEKSVPESYRITLVEGAVYGIGTHNFYGGKSVTTADRNLYDLVKDNGRFLCKVVGGAK